ncbi:hypothetical protein [Streptomyces sp. NBC_01497]|uniref:hypothetical protein n=1 Tax=Streptomyces sp. NBC_01497 TaxID=2903885 RepID=UPI002E30950F|nr:hypothetical protein [Streptomyces sp. NBC_01497]
MISTRHFATLLAIAAGASGLGASSAAAVEPLMQPQSVSVTDTLNDLSSAGMPADQKGQVPTLASQLQGLNQVNQLQQLTGLAAPATGLLPSLG